MAAVMALQENWFPPETTNIANNLNFKGVLSVLSHTQNHSLCFYCFTVNNNIHGLISSVNDGSTSAFMWEWFTTKPWIDRGEARFVRMNSWKWPTCD